MEYRIEKDTMGEIKVPKNAYWQHRPKEVSKILRSAKRKCLMRSQEHFLT